MLYDKQTIFVHAGRGGDGSASFRREAHVPRGGVDGGDGGDGGDVILEVDTSRRDLAHLRRKLKYVAESGGPGGRRNRSGKRGNDLVVPVPAGTQAFDDENRMLCDLTGPGQRAVIARGGGGGRGNTHFVSSTRRAPAFAEVGMPGEEREVSLRLKLLADAALVGFPNAGKSSLLRRISNARPKVADYPFTTLAPVLGTLERSDGSQIVVADVPGLLEGASQGHGLGHEFLAHLERAQLLAHLVTLEEPADVGERLRTIHRELYAYNPRIARLPQLIVLSKADLATEEGVQQAREQVEQEIARADDRMGEVRGIHVVSSATSQGVTDLVNALFRENSRDAPAAAGRAPALSERNLEEYRVYRPQPRRRGWKIYKDRDGLRVAGDPMLAELAHAAVDDPQAADRLLDELERIGALRALLATGIKPGTSVIVGDTPFAI